MKYTAIVRFDSTFEYWVGTQPEPNAEPVYDKVDERKAMVLPMGGGILALLTRESLEDNSLIRNLRDAEGNPVLTQGGGTSADFFVRNGEPQFNVLGVIEGYRYAIRRK